MPTYYEFVVETLDTYPGCGDDPDIIDTSAFDSLEEAHNFAKLCEESWRIALRRDTGNQDEGLTERYYAYPDDSGQLPQNMETAMGFEDGPKIPSKYIKMKFPVDSKRTK